MRGSFPNRVFHRVIFVSPMKENSFFRFIFRESKMTKKTPKGHFFINKASRSEKEITYPRLVDRSDYFTSMNITSSLEIFFVF